MKRFGAVEDPLDSDGDLVADQKVRKKPFFVRYRNYFYLSITALAFYCVIWYSNNSINNNVTNITFRYVRILYYLLIWLLIKLFIRSRPTMSPTPSPTVMIEEINLPLIDPLCITKLPHNPYEKHIVDPPHGDVTLVCCKSTKGIFNVAVHLAWAPLGAARFLEMVETNFFTSEVPLFRSLKGFLIQFGLAGINCFLGYLRALLTYSY